MVNSHTSFMVHGALSFRTSFTHHATTSIVANTYLVENVRVVEVHCVSEQRAQVALEAVGHTVPKLEVLGTTAAPPSLGSVRRTNSAIVGLLRRTRNELGWAHVRRCMFGMSLGLTSSSDVLGCRISSSLV